VKRVAAAFVLLVLTGCVSVSKVETGDNAVGDRLALSLPGAWNRVSEPGSGPAQTWTMEGLPVDRLLIYSGLRDGEAIHAPPALFDRDRKTFRFRSGMQPDEIAALFEGWLTRDGSSYRLLKLEPSTFGGKTGFRFEYAVTRRIDNVQLSGVGFGAVSKGELFALVYMAPRLAFFGRHAPSVEQIARTARLRE
jgi:hypothetical protein